MKDIAEAVEKYEPANNRSQVKITEKILLSAIHIMPILQACIQHWNHLLL